MLHPVEVNDLLMLSDAAAEGGGWDWSTVRGGAVNNPFVVENATHQEFRLIVSCKRRDPPCNPDDE